MEDLRTKRDVQGANKVLFIGKGILRLVLTVLVCVFLAALGYVLIIACIFLFPPHAVL
jgi:hypothetical protein